MELVVKMEGNEVVVRNGEDAWDAPLLAAEYNFKIEKVEIKEE